jgi:hypothetical protein
MFGEIVYALLGILRRTTYRSIIHVNEQVLNMDVSRITGRSRHLSEDHAIPL